MSTSINVTACDNELHIIASTEAGSAEVCHLSSGNNDPVAYQVNLGSILPPGDYSLTMVGINWGGPAAFTVNVTTSSGTTPYTYSDGSAPVGVVWSKTISVTV